MIARCGKLLRTGSTCGLRADHPYSHRAVVADTKYCDRWKFQRRLERYGKYKAGRPCADCGLHFHSVAMDFDHRPGEVKLFNISASSSRTDEEVEREIAKCDLVCANCHRVRTHTRKLNGKRDPFAVLGVWLN